MFTCRVHRRRFRIARRSAILCTTTALLAAPFNQPRAQVPADAAPADWRTWAFGRLGPARTSQVDANGRADAVLVSLGGGVAASYGALVGMVRTTYNVSATLSDSPTTGTRDFALLGGVCSRGDRLFFVAAGGIAQAAQTDGGLGTANQQLALAFDLSAHANYHVGGLALAISGVLGPPSTRYVAMSLGAELGWFGR